MKLIAIDLTLDEVQAEAEAIEALARTASPDHESLHSMEDDLRLVVLHAVALGRLDGLEAQRAALLLVRLSGVNFTRWCG